MEEEVEVEAAAGLVGSVAGGTLWREEKAKVRQCMSARNVHTERGKGGGEKGMETYAVRRRSSFSTSSSQTSTGIVRLFLNDSTI